MDWESSRCPSGIGGVAVVAIRRNAYRDVIWIRRLVIGLLMTSIAGIWCGGIIPVMAGIAVVCNGGMGAGKRIVVAMDGECGRCPSRIGRVACFAGIWNADGDVVRIGRLVIIAFMAAKAAIGCGGIIPVMTGIAVICNGGMRTGKRVVVAMDGECGRRPTWIGRVACFAGVRYSNCCMVRIGRLGISRIMTIRTDGSGARITADVTELAFNGGMCAGQREIRIVVIEASSATGGMAGITCLAVVCVAPNTLVLFIHVGLEVRMAVNTTENSIIIRVGMTIST